MRSPKHTPNEQRFAIGGIVPNMNELQRAAIPEVGRMSDPNIGAAPPPASGGEDTSPDFGEIAAKAVLHYAANKVLPGSSFILGRLGFADGGPVGLRYGHEPRHSGKASTSIPARLSDGEYVLCSRAVKIIGRDKLEKLNALGLLVREGMISQSEGRAIAQHWGLV